MLEVAAQLHTLGFTKSAYIMPGAQPPLVADISVLCNAFHDLYALGQLHMMVLVHLLSFSPLLLEEVMRLMGGVGGDSYKNWRDREVVKGVFHQA